jgi:hypothetical protein
MVLMGLFMALSLLLLTSILGLRHTCHSKHPPHPGPPAVQILGDGSTSSENSESEADWPSMAGLFFNAINAAQISFFLLAFALSIIPCYGCVPSDEPVKSNWIAAALQSRAPPVFG